jgi:hypothetical protein
MNPILQSILTNENELAIKLINESYINLVSCLDTAAALDQRDVVLALLKYSKVNCSGLLMEELLSNKLFNMAQIFIENKRLWGSAADVFINGNSIITYPNQQEFLEWQVYYILGDQRRT